MFLPSSRAKFLKTENNVWTIRVGTLSDSVPVTQPVGLPESGHFLKVSSGLFKRELLSLLWDTECYWLLLEKSGRGESLATFIVIFCPSRGPKISFSSKGKTNKSIKFSHLRGKKPESVWFTLLGNNTVHITIKALSIGWLTNHNSSYISYRRLYMPSTVLQVGQVCFASLSRSTQNGMRQQPKTKLGRIEPLLAQ